MAERKIQHNKEAGSGSPSGRSISHLPRGDSRKILGDDGRRNRFKDRGKDLERGVSAPNFFAASGDDNETSIKVGPKAPLPRNEEEAVTVGQGLGHNFAKKNFFQPTHCQFCSELLWGIKGQGFSCAVCNYVAHEKCIPFLTMPCRHIIADMIQDPVPHKWTNSIQMKKKPFCNVCRKKICHEGVLCEVCKYYSHVGCKDLAFYNCKQCATYSFGVPTEDTHHWIEGNLPSGARCQICTKGCASTDCLTGFRCGWCGIAVHSKCHEKYKMTYPKCTFRDLWGMILVPRAVSHRKVVSDAPTTPTTGDATSPSVEVEEAEEDTDGGKGKPCIVVDGSSQKGFKRWRKATVHPTYLSKKMTARELLVISLKKCGISDDPEEYYLADGMDKDQERELAPDEIPYNIEAKSHAGILRFYIRHKVAHKDSTDGVELKGKMRINNGFLESTVKFVTIVVKGSTPTKEIVSQALVKFDMEEENPDDFCLVEVSQIQGMTEKVLADTDCPWKKFHDLRRDSLTMSNRQRYFLRHRKGGKTSIYLGGVAKDILALEEKYTSYVKSLVAEESLDGVEIGPPFPSMSGLILTFPTFELAVKLTQTMEQNPNRPTIVMLPSIYADVPKINQEPLLVFVNGKSGGNQGVELLSAFRRHLNPHQVWDLSKGGPIPGLWSMRHLKTFRIMIGGGDGTFGWVLGALQEMKEYLTYKEPPCGLLPLGTGNDLARALKWGGGYSGEKVMQVLLSLEDANVVHLDRWSVYFKEQQLMKGEKRPSTLSPAPPSVVMNNYTGIGLDAAIALDFHLAREENPEKFSSRLHNKGYYLQLGLQKMVSKGETHELRRHVTLTVDGKRVELPDIAGLIFLNIQSWGAGADPWGTTSDPAYKPAAYDDGLLEVVGIKGVMQMGQVQSGIRNAVRIAQGSEFSIDILSPVPVQVDGEAWAQPPSTMTIRKLPDAATLLQGPHKVEYAKQLSKKKETSQIELLGAVSNSGILFSEGLSTRRSVPGGPHGSPAGSPSTAKANRLGSPSEEEK